MARRSIRVKHAMHLGFWRVLIVGGLLATASTTSVELSAPVVKAPTSSSVATPKVTKIALVETTTTTAVTTTTVVPPWSVGNTGPFALAPGSVLPSDAECAARVSKAPENRPGNRTANQTKGTSLPATFRNWGTNPAAVGYARRVDGQFTGTTDEIIQWASCKWGFDPEPVRAQVMVESGWRQSAYAGFIPDTGNCSDPRLRRAIAPTSTTTLPATTTTIPDATIIETTTTTTTTTSPEQTPSTSTTSTTSTTVAPPAFECPTAYGLMQVRSDFQPGSFPMSANSTAWNLDYSLALKRACYDGVGWHGAKTTGDAWGCVGIHYSGQWLDDPAKAYIAKIQAAEQTKAWLRF